MTDHKVEQLLSRHYEGLALQPRVAAKTFAGGLLVGVLVMALAVSLAGVLPAEPLNLRIGFELSPTGELASLNETNIRQGPE